MKIKKVVEKQVEITEALVCNFCGLKYNDNEFEGTNACANIGYNAKHLDDGDFFVFEICEKCLKEKLFPIFKVAPENLNGGD